MGKIKLSKKFADAVKRMPPLRHSIPGNPFDISESEVVKWLCRQKAIMQYVFDRAKANGLIEYDPETGAWQGVEWEGDGADA